MRTVKNLLAAAVATLSVSCSETKFVPDGHYLLDKVDVETDGKYADINTSLLKDYVAQKGNSRWFSTVKIPLATYSLAGRDSTKWLNRTLKAMGEAPAVYDSLKAARSCLDLAQQLRNDGYLGATVSVATKTHKRKINATYTLHPGRSYSVGRVAYDIADSAIAAMPALSDPKARTVKTGMRFSVAALERERERITSYLNDHGYYRFNKDFITFEADTARGALIVDVTLVLHPFVTPDKQTAPHPRYKIGRVAHSCLSDGDTTMHLRRSVLAVNTFVEQGDDYSSSALKRTYNRFGRLQAVKYTDIKFHEAATDSLSLDCDIQLSTNKPHSVSFQPEGTNTAGDLGAAVSLTYENRNLFRGSEVLSIELRGAFEAIKGLEGYNNDNFEEYSAQASLTFPRFIAPFLARSFRRRVNATSEVSMLYDLQNRPEYHRRVLSVAWRYKWNDSRHHDKYQLDLLDLNYIFMPWISDTFRHDYLEDNESRNAILRYNYEDLFIMKMGVGYSYNNGRYAIKANVETAGNLLNAYAKAVGSKTDEQGRRTLFNIAYAQYAKADFDYTRNLQFDYDNQLVFHADFGIAYPYGNSSILPFEKRYFSGGANSVRGWGVRELGPGKYKRSDGKIDFINQTGDVKLDLSMEYRAKLFWKLNGAVFVDAGNIWTLRDYADQPGGQFRFSEFWKQIAASYGLGVRFNFDYFILRFDFAMKAVNPAYEDSRQHYPIVHPRLSRDLTFHFAVGLPF